MVDNIWRFQKEDNHPKNSLLALSFWVIEIISCSANGLQLQTYGCMNDSVKFGTRWPIVVKFGFK